MSHVVPIPVLPNAVAFATMQKRHAQTREIAQGSEFSQLFSEHVAPELEIGEAHFSIPGRTVRVPSATTEDLIPEHSSTGHAGLQALSPDLVSAGSSHSESLLQVHLAGNHAVRKEPPAGGSQADDIASAPLAAGRSGRTGSVSSTPNDSKTKRLQAGTPSTGTTATPSCSVEMIPLSVHPVAPFALERGHSPSGSVEEHVQPSKAQFASTPGAKAASQLKNELRDETPSIADQVSLGPRSSEDQTAPAPGASPNREAAPAPANGVSPKEAQQPLVPTANPSIPHGGHPASEKSSVETIPSVNTGGSVVTPHPVQIQSPLSPAQPISQAPAIITPPAASLSPNLYDRMDQDVAPAVLHSGAQHVVVGLQDPNLGWLEIKTQNVAGHVDATLVTASGQAHASLAGQLPSIAEYLQQRELRIGTLAVQHHMPDANAGVGTGNGSASTDTSAQNSNHSGSGRREEGTARPSTPNLRPGGPAPKTTIENHPTFQPVSYISVRA